MGMSSGSSRCSSRWTSSRKASTARAWQGSTLLKEDGAEAVLDAGFIAGCQRVEHYEITAYGSLMAWAKLLGRKEALALLKANELEEKAADAKLSKLAESTINAEALHAGAAE